MKNRLLVSMVFLLACASLFAQASITVIFPKHEADLSGAFAARVKEFEAASKMKVNLIQMGWDDVNNKLTAEMASGGSSYDVVEFDNGNVAAWLGAGWVEPLNPYMPKGFTDGMIPGLLDLFTGADGKLYGIVWNNDTRFFFYNAEMLKKAGIANPPRTWDELISQSKTLMGKGIAKYGMAGFWKAEWALVNDFHFYIYTYGGKIVDKQGNFLFNKDPGTLAACQEMVKFLKEGVMDPASLTYDQEAVNNIFLKGDTAFLNQGIPGIMAYAQDASRSRVVGQVKVGLVPGGKAGVSAALTLPEAYAIPKGSKNKAAAWKFIEYMTGKDVNKKLAQDIGILPIWTAQYTDRDLVKLFPYWADFSRQMGSARGLSVLTWYNNFVDVAITESQKMLSGKVSPQAALDEMADLLKDYKGKP
ncbi:MAG TPA: sugar ABC transporter substrate-binding protein [Spirochaetia bacterium]|nr:sugar ABC transporter substrate-binding protein [Spirochaetia bacterium]